MSRTPPFRAPSAPARPQPPCRANPEGWSINPAVGPLLAAQGIRDAVEGCMYCQFATPQFFAYCQSLPTSARPPRTVLAGRVVTTKGKLVDPERYITLSLPCIKPNDEELYAAAQAGAGR